MIWIAFLSMSALAFATVLLPLLRTGDRGSHLSAEASSAAVFADQLAEVARDERRGLISAPEAREAAAEIKRRLLGQAGRIDRGAGSSRGRAVVLAAALSAPILAGAYYSQFGSPAVASLPFAARAGDRAATAEVAAATARLRETLETDPEGGASEGWMLLGRTYARMGRTEAAISAFEIVTARDDAPSAAHSFLAETLITAEGGVVAPRAERAVDAALAADPRNPAGTFYKAQALVQRDDIETAYRMLLDRLENSRELRPWMPSFVDQANRLGARLGQEPVSLAELGFAPPEDLRGPTASDVAAAADMTAEGREAFIRSMVDRLAARLESEPGDISGWLRLGRSYHVLGDIGAARGAYSRAKALLADAPDDDPRKIDLSNALQELES